MFLFVPWTATNQRHRFSLDLTNADGQAVLTPDETPMTVQGEFEMGRPPGAPHGSDLNQPFVLPVPQGLELAQGQMYEWRLEIDGHHEPDWSARSSCCPAQPLG